LEHEKWSPISAGETITSDAGALLLREIEAANHFFDDFASCFVDHREQGYVEHSWLNEDRRRCKKQRHIARGVCVRLVEVYGFSGSYRPLPRV